MATANFLVSDDEYYQALGVEYIPTGYLNGTAMGFSQINAKLRVREKVTEYRGYLTDGGESLPGGLDYQQSSGTFKFVKYEKRVSRRRVNEAGFWRYTVTEKWCALYINGTWNCGAAANSFRS